MVVFLLSDKNFEQQATLCIKSLQMVMPVDVKIVYFTIGFNSDLVLKNLYKHYIDFNPKFDRFTYYKPDLSLMIMDMFPNDFYIYTDADILFSPRFSIEKVINPTLSYPLASFGMYEFPFTFDTFGGIRVYNVETDLMNYFNVPNRTMRYVWACFYSFNSFCKDFLEEWSSMCNNKYLYEKRRTLFPFHDETSFNVCLWKRAATNSLGFAFVNTNELEILKSTENGGKIQLDLNTDVHSTDSNTNILFYHGFNNLSEMSSSLDYLLTL